MDFSFLSDVKIVLLIVFVLVAVYFFWVKVVKPFLMGRGLMREELMSLREALQEVTRTPFLLREGLGFLLTDKYISYDAIGDGYYIEYPRGRSVRIRALKGHKPVILGVDKMNMGVKNQALRAKHLRDMASALNPETELEKLLVQVPALERSDVVRGMFDDKGGASEPQGSD